MMKREVGGQGVMGFLPFEGSVVHLTLASSFSPWILLNWSLRAQGPVHPMLEPSGVEKIPSAQENFQADGEEGGPGEDGPPHAWAFLPGW